jgi:diaminohydroxyphosphoribosylaminopyrimidine deaminase/5-amino-6-(5-phosphoribosylamino)uracil reductase
LELSTLRKAAIPTAVIDDETWMRLALEEAAKGVGRTAPNPPVGAILVKNGAELGRGWHRRAGEPHAEREALAAATAAHGNDALAGATAYVTLEPCSTRGRTPACTDGLIEAGVGRVVYALRDPNPAHAGAADRILRDAGIEVRTGVLAAEAADLVRSFAKVQRTGLPWIIWKTAMSLDGRLTRPPGESRWLSNETSRDRVQHLRAECDAILTSGETVRRDRPRLDLRKPTLLHDGRKQPWRIVVTRDDDRLPRDAPLFTDDHRHRTLTRPWHDPEGLLRSLVREQHIHTVFLECGGRLAGELQDRGLIDELVAFLTPLMTGGGVPALGGHGAPDGLALERARFERLKSDVMLRARLGPSATEHQRPAPRARETRP